MPPDKKPGRNEPCWCGSGRKYKRCHFRQDQEAASAAAQSASAAAAPAPAPTPPPPAQRTARELVKAPERTPEQAAADAAWDQFMESDASEKVQLFLQRVDEQRLDKEDAFEMLLAIREAMDMGQDAGARTQFRMLVDRLQASLPDVYREERGFLLESLLMDAVVDQDWDRVASLLPPLAEIAHEKVEEFFRVIEALKYHNQTQLLIETIKTAWSPVVGSSNVTSWGIHGLVSTLLDANLFRYLETTTHPHVDDPVLVKDLPEGVAYDQTELAKAFPHLIAPSPAPWQPADFGETVDADTWEENVDALLFEFIAEQHRASHVPLMRSRSMQAVIKGVLREQLGRLTPARPKAKRGQVVRSHALIPMSQSLDRRLVAKFNLLGGGEPYLVVAVLEVLPAYLHFLARLSLIHPTEMDAALADLDTLVAPTIELARTFGADVHAIRNVEAAWSAMALDALRSDPGLAEARRAPLAVATPAQYSLADARTYRFRVTYLRADDVWFEIEMQRDETLDDLHRAIQKAADFDSDHPYSFYLSGRAWDEETEYSTGKSSFSSRSKIKDLPLRLKQRFLYLFDYGDQHEFEVQLMSIGEGLLRSWRIVEQHGTMPSQYGEWEDDESEQPD